MAKRKVEGIPKNICDVSDDVKESCETGAPYIRQVPLNGELVYIFVVKNGHLAHAVYHLIQEACDQEITEITEYVDPESN